MSRAVQVENEPTLRVLGRGLRAERGVRLTLRTLRDAADRTQSDIAARSGIAQADVSRLEHRVSFDDCLVSTLERYIRALGGRLDLVATFGEKRFTLVGLEPATGTGSGVVTSAIVRQLQEDDLPGFD